MSGKTIRVDVTAEDIAAGVPRVVDACPVARALNRAARTPWGWRVGLAPSVTDGRARAWLTVGTEPPASVLLLPRRVAAFIRAFDRGTDVEPFSFRIER